ncbi:hypothetical protein PF66_06238 [Pseudomonas asplenii]|uniref:Uncharacterized protein n=1 Tax=Pseudomonas asplenii TaxID=53407 RepID=A0A0M9GC63_9PSED|nr:hypothetical protein [Pseudomonas fuscovaginae]KPA87328.1 hypothetical protein PF66_06238 [Pseudomonas fuscovaginae]
MISNELSLIQQNETLRASLASAVEEFLAGGGQIDVRQITASKGVSVIERIQTPNFQSSSAKSESDAQARRISELAKTLNREEICEREGLSLGVLRGIAKRYGIQFLAGPKKAYAPNKRKPKEDAELIEKIKDCMARGITRYQACKELEISSTLIRRIIADHNIDYPVVTR